MGCVNSRTDINSRRPNIFQVMNVDDLGNLITPGQLEITEADIILYQRDKNPIKWPLCYLRRYGHDAEIFSFESGRKCSTGQGIYAFKCRRADDLFHLVQSKILSCNNTGDDTTREPPISSHPGTTRITSPSEPNYLEPTPVRNNSRGNSRFPHSQQNGVGRLGSIGSSTGPLSPGPVMNSPSPPPTLPQLPPPPPPTLQSQASSVYVNEEILLSLPLGIEHNNDESLQRTIPRSHTIDDSTHNFGTNSEVTSMQQNKPSPTLAPYVNIDINNIGSPLSPNCSTSETAHFKEDTNEMESFNRLYVNINPSQEYSESTITKTRPPPLPPLQQSEPEGIIRHCYVNLEPSEIEVLKHRIPSISISEKSTLPPSTPSGTAIREVNYAVLDLNKKDSPSGSTDNGSNALLSPTPESPNRSQKGYAMIDFNKTAALSHSVNSNLVNDNDEGSRKTRHNSTMNDLTTPKHNSPISE